MKQLYKLLACFTLVCLLGNKVGFSQTFSAQANFRINTNIGGFYEYYPLGYNSGSTRYPLIVFLHGYGAVGSGNTSELPRVLSEGLPKNISQGIFPTSFTSGGKTYQFLVICPQFFAWPTATDVASVINFARNRYRVDTTRIYLTGLSMGGGVTWDYAGSSLMAASKLAAIVPICGAATTSQAKANNMAAANLPVWATHNQADFDVRPDTTNKYIRLINELSPAPPTPLAKKTIFANALNPAETHDAWTQTYSTSFRENSMNIYEWMLQYTRAEATLPVTLSNYRIVSSEKQGVTIGWTTTAEQNNSYFNIERSTDGESFNVIGKVNGTNLATGSSYTFTDSRPVNGTNYYRLTQTDFDGRTKTYEILSTVIDYGIANGKFTLFPNPAKSSITVAFNHPDKDRLLVKVINTQGMIVQMSQYNKEAGYWQQNILIDRLPAGQYFVQVKGAVFESTQTLMIEK